jgi:RNA polymerase sigma factor (sigma-70 family)
MAMSDDATVRLVARWQAGDQEAADELFHRYADQLVALARGRMSAKLGRRVDAEDVVQSAYRSFFFAAREGRFQLERGGDLWRLLVALTLRKIHRQVRRNQAGKRTIDRERSLGDESVLEGVSPLLLTETPSPVEALALAEELEWVMAQLEPVHRAMLQLRLQGHNLEEIAAATERSERTVTRVLREVKGLLEQRRAQGPDG